MNAASTGIVRGLVRACVLLPWLSGGPTPADAQLRGTVVDAGGRTLPLVVVVSRTRNGFLGMLTDAHGRFAFGGRPHARGDRIELNAMGFRPTTIRLQGNETEIAVTMEPDSASATLGWTVGLADTFDVAIVGPEGNAVALGNSVVTGRHYRIELTLHGQQNCTRLGPVPVVAEPGRVTIAVGVYQRREGCSEAITTLVQTVDHAFDRAGPVQLRLVGRWHDETISLVAEPPREPGG